MAIDSASELLHLVFTQGGNGMSTGVVPVGFNAMHPGDPFPWLAQRTPSTPLFSIDLAASRYIVLCFFGSLADPAGRGALAAVQQHRALFDDRRACWFGVSVDPQDEAQARVAESMPGIRVLWDFDEAVSKGCGIVPADGGPAGAPRVFRRSWVILDPTLHVLAVFSFEDAGGAHERVFEFLRRLPAPADYGGFEIPAPVLVLPNVFEPDLCRHLIAVYEAEGGRDSGVMRDGGFVVDSASKRRKDVMIADEGLRQTLRHRLHRRVVPEIRKLFFMEITRVDRYVVGCYAAEDGGHLTPHRDNTDRATAHRRFALSINLNGDFEGGAVTFPEYNLRGIKAPPGWAVVFSCAMLHAVTKVTAGRRYAFLPFVYDEDGARIREAALRQAAPRSDAPNAAAAGAG